jgi:Domain of unknown function (DUF222)
MAGAAPTNPAAIDVPTPSELAKLSTAQLLDMAVATSRRMASVAARFVQLTAELDRREGWRTEGATSLEAWIVERCGASVPSARAYAHVGERLFDLPHLAAGLADGALTFDKVRAVVDGATPETDQDVARQAVSSSVRELTDIARAASGASAPRDRENFESRSVRFNDTFRTVTAQLPRESFAEVRSCLEARAKQLPSDGQTPWDQRLADAFVSLVRSCSGATDRGGPSRSTPYTVVCHVPLTSLLDDSGAEGAGIAGATALAAELERGGLISMETVRRLACDATLIVAVDDDVGHTMYEGRQRRFPTAAQSREIRRRDRHCRFPGCANAIFTNVHHIVPWEPRGPTDLPNLALICEYHHHLLHSKQWSMSGNANEEVTFEGPSGRVMTSRPSALWTTVTGPKRSSILGD